MLDETLTATEYFELCEDETVGIDFLIEILSATEASEVITRGVPYVSCIDSITKDQLDTSKVAIDSISHDEFQRLRGKKNTYESLGKGPKVYGQSCFINRSAMKMCNMDKAFFLVPCVSNKATKATKKPDLSMLCPIGNPLSE